MDAHKRLGETIRRLRLERGFTQEELAFRAELSVVYLSGLERGKRNPTLSVMLDLAQALAVTAADLLLGIERKPKRHRQ